MLHLKVGVRQRLTWCNDLGISRGHDKIDGRWSTACIDIANDTGLPIRFNQQSRFLVDPNPHRLTIPGPPVGVDSSQNRHHPSQSIAIFKMGIDISIVQERVQIGGNKILVECEIGIKWVCHRLRRTGAVILG